MPSIEELVPPQHLLPDYARSRSYTAAGARFLETARSRGLQPHHRVLDLGCGVGRFAVALAGYLDERGSYVGVDIHKRSIRLCRKYVGRKLDNFKFKRVRPLDAAEFRFPFSAASFDFVFSNSLFTHLLPEVAENYLTEIGRLLRPGGRTLNTLFLLNPESLALLDSGASPQGTTHDVWRRPGAGEADRSAPGMDRPRRGPCPCVARARAHADRGSDPLRLMARA